MWGCRGNGQPDDGTTSGRNQVVARTFGSGHETAESGPAGIRKASQGLRNVPGGQSAKAFGGKSPAVSSVGGGTAGIWIVNSGSVDQGLVSDCRTRRLNRTCPPEPWHPARG